MSSVTFAPHILFQPCGDGICWPDFETTDGRPAVMCFTNRDRAQAFLAGKGMGAQWNVGQMTQPEFLRWLRQNLLTGRPLVMVDPTAAGGTAVEILQFLAMVEPDEEG